MEYFNSFWFFLTAPSSKDLDSLNSLVAIGVAISIAFAMLENLANYWNSYFSSAILNSEKKFKEDSLKSEAKSSFIDKGIKYFQDDYYAFLKSVKKSIGYYKIYSSVVGVLLIFFLAFSPLLQIKLNFIYAFILLLLVCSILFVPFLGSYLKYRSLIKKNNGRLTIIKELAEDDDKIKEIKITPTSIS